MEADALDAQGGVGPSRGIGRVAQSFDFAPPDPSSPGAGRAGSRVRGVKLLDAAGVDWKPVGLGECLEHGALVLLLTHRRFPLSSGGPSHLDAGRPLKLPQVTPPCGPERSEHFRETVTLRPSRPPPALPPLRASYCRHPRGTMAEPK